MPAQRPLKSYPEYYAELFRFVAAREEPFAIRLATPKRARVIRADLYNFRYALRDADLSRSATDEQLETLRAAERVKIRVEEEDSGTGLLVLYTAGFNELKEIVDEQRNHVSSSL